MLPLLKIKIINNLNWIEIFLFTAWSEPTNEIALMSGLSQIKLTASLSPWIILTTPSGKPASFANWTSIIQAPGSFSDGLITMVLPHAVATGNIHKGIIAGKLNGVIPAVTPIID